MMLSNRTDRQFRLDGRLVLSAFALAALCIYFWTSSRYPALNEKALMGADTPMSGLAFDILLDVFPNSPMWWEILANIANWIYTNLRGMAFGVFFGAGLLTLLSVINKRSFENGFANAALGTAIGAPLGVCVNCAAPIALGLHMGRMRLETTLSALVASPTLNVIVVSMSFALLPFHVATTKLLLSLLFVLLIIPLLCRYILKSETAATATNVSKTASLDTSNGLSGWIGRALTPRDEGPPTNTIAAALMWFARTYSRNFFFIALITVPMMFVAALLAAIISTGINSSALAQVLPAHGAVMIIGAMVLIAVVASIAPAPIALDVVLTAVLLGVGLRSDYATVAVIALGSYSVYAFFVLWRGISLRTALVIWAVALALSVTGGLIANRLSSLEDQYVMNRVEAYLKEAQPWTPDKIPPLAKAPLLNEFKSELAQHAVRKTALAAAYESDRGSIIETHIILPMKPGKQVVTADNQTSFTRISGQNIGFDELGIQNPIRELAPETFLGGISAGDINSDGWTDVIVPRPTGAKGLSVYLNLTGTFQRIHMDLGEVSAFEIINVALVDLDNDHALDLVVSTKWNGLHIFYNQEGNFSKNQRVHIPAKAYSLAMSLAFADMDRDGKLDIILGNWTQSLGRPFWGAITSDNGKNQIAWNTGNRKFDLREIDGSGGQTLTTLVSDFNNDGYPDLLKGDDMASSDQVIYFTKGRETLPITRENQPFPYLLNTTMTMDVGDWNNDLLRDYYGGQIADQMNANRDATVGDGRLLEICMQFGKDDNWSTKEIRQCALEIKSIDHIRGGKQSLYNQQCDGIYVAEHKTICNTFTFYLELTQRTRKENPQQLADRCETVLANHPEARRQCGALRLSMGPRPDRKTWNNTHSKGIRDRNILMTGTKENTFTDDATKQSIQFPGWTWNSKFNDLDQDGWQDILVMTGIWLSPSRSSTNVFYKNEAGKFTDKTQTYGFHDVVPSFSYVSFDYDRDGDVDVIRDAGSLRMTVHRNDKPAGKALWISLRDTKGNSMGIGATVTICTDGESTVRSGKCQMRDIKASGGYMSFDPISAHFGLGDAKSVSLIKVKWPDGEVSNIRPQMLSDGELTISRH